MSTAFTKARPLRALFAGLGHAGQRHLRNLANRVPVRVVALRQQGHPIDADLQDLVVDESDDLDKLLGRELDAVFIANPTSMHLDVALPAARAGRPIFLEKPVSDGLDRVDDLRKEVRERGLLCLVGYNARFRPTLRKIRSWIGEGRLGRPLSARAQIGEWLPDWHPEEDYRVGVSARRELGGGVVLDLSHELDYLPWLLGPVRSLFCIAGRMSSLQIETEDLAEILLKFGCGAIGNVHLDYLQRQPSRTLRLIGEDGTILWDAVAPEARLLDHATGEWQVFRDEPGERERSFELEMDHFLECLSGEAEAESDLESGIQALRLTAAAKESATRGEVVEIDGTSV